MTDQGTIIPQENIEVTDAYDHIVGGTRKLPRTMPMYIGAIVLSVITVICVIIAPIVMSALGVPLMEALKFGAIAAVIAGVLSFCIYPMFAPPEPAGPTKTQQKTLDDIKRTRDAVEAMNAALVPEYGMEHVEAHSRLNRALRWKSERGGSEWNEENAKAVAAFLFEDLNRLPLILELIRVEGVTNAEELRVKVIG